MEAKQIRLGQRVFINHGTVIDFEAVVAGKGETVVHVLPYERITASDIGIICRGGGSSFIGREMFPFSACSMGKLHAHANTQEKHQSD